MDIYQNLLERMASISPGVRLHLEGEHWQVHIDADDVTPKLLVNECISLMIDEVFELGLEFFCTRDSLCDSLYHVDKLLLFFEVIYPTPLYRSINEDGQFKSWLISLVRDGAGDTDYTTAMNLLHYLSVDHPSTGDTFQDTYVFLQDKLVSTQTFDTYVQSIIDADNAQFEAPVDHQQVCEYLDHITKNIATLLRVIDFLSNSNPDPSLNIKDQYFRLQEYKTNATRVEGLHNNVWVYHQTKKSDVKPFPIEQAYIERFTIEFESVTPLFERYFRFKGQQLLKEDIFSILLGLITISPTKEVFMSSVDLTFQRLSDITPKSDSTLHVFIQTLCFNISKEAYK